MFVKKKCWWDHFFSAATLALNFKVVTNFVTNVLITSKLFVFC